MFLFRFKSLCYRAYLSYYCENIKLQIPGDLAKLYFEISDIYMKNTLFERTQTYQFMFRSLKHSEN